MCCNYRGGKRDKYTDIQTFKELLRKIIAKQIRLLHF